MEIKEETSLIKIYVSDKAAPISVLATFQNGHPSEDHIDQLSFGYYQCTDKGSSQHRKRILVAETDHTQYIGKNYGPFALRAPDQRRYMVGVYDKDKCKVKLIDANVLRLCPIEDEDSDKEKETVEETKKLSYREKNEGLIEAFGSSKGNRLVRSRQRNEVMSGKVLEVAVGSAVDEAFPSLSSVNVLSEEKATIDYLPRYNKDASCPQDVYLLADLLNDVEMDALFAPAHIFIGSTNSQISEWRNVKRYPAYILNQLEFLPASGEERSRRARILLYLYFLYVAYNLRATDLRQKKPLPPDVPSVIKKRIFDDFTNQVMSTKGTQTIYMPKNMKDKLLLHILVIVLVLEDFSVDFTPLEEDIGKKLRPYFEQLGCKIMTQKKSTGNSNLAILQVPLTFPKPRVQKAKKRR